MIALVGCGAARPEVVSTRAPVAERETTQAAAAGAEEATTTFDPPDAPAGAQASVPLYRVTTTERMAVSPTPWVVTIWESGAWTSSEPNGSLTQGTLSADEIDALARQIDAAPLEMFEMTPTQVCLAVETTTRSDYSFRSRHFRPAICAGVSPFDDVTMAAIECAMARTVSPSPAGLQRCRP